MKRRLKLNTDYWTIKQSHEEWIRRYQKLNWTTLIFIVANLTYGLYTSNTIILIINTIPTITGLIIYLSYIKRNKS